MRETNRTSWLAIISLSMLWAYFCIVLLYQEPLGGITVRIRHLGVILLAGSALIALGLRWLGSRGILTKERRANGIAVSLSLLVSLVAADALYSVYESASRNLPEPEALERERLTDPQIWLGELYPRSYRPTEMNFTLHKPNVQLGGQIFGEFYNTRMLDSPTLAGSVLQLRRVVYSIDEHGFRNDTPMEEARLFALGDSFVFGYSTDEGNIWIDHLETLIGEPIYNLGVSATGPGSQMLLLDHLVRSKPDTFRVEHLLWMIYEGNDLENSYAQRFSATSGVAGVSTRVWGATFRPLIEGIKRRSVIAKTLDGELSLREWSANDRGNPFLVDGVNLEFPLYRSSTLGYKLFNPIDIERARKNEAYVLSHPNRPRLDEAFRKMSSLSDELGFRVTVIIAPSAARMHGSQFEDFPAPSAEPHFIRYVAALSERSGFQAVDLLELMKPRAEQELLYYRDDHHWDERGNEVAARVIAAAVQF